MRLLDHIDVHLVVPGQLDDKKRYHDRHDFNTVLHSEGLGIDRMSKLELHPRPYMNKSYMVVMKLNTEELIRFLTAYILNPAF
jgi:hypothetical protein